MKYGLGIDAGGTYTDSVIYDFEKSEVVASSKSLTQKVDLRIGINDGLSKLPGEILKQVKLVSLSTTLATNACIEGKGSKATLIFIGCDKDTVAKYGYKYGLPAVSEMIFIEGGYTYEGDFKGEPDWDLLTQEVLKLKTLTQSFAIVEMSSVKGNEYEIKAKNMVINLTGLTVINSTEVSRELNFMKRAASALINAELIPLINEFLDAVKDILKYKNIDAPVVIVRGDGSLMSQDYARKMPVETLLSGPAASVIGAMNLSGRKDCIIVDMGGTTSDLAIVENGRIKFAHNGLKIGKWNTGTKSIWVRPIGLGGDSLITFDNNNKLVISPVRAAPLSWLSHLYPGTLKEMDKIYNNHRFHTESLCEFFYLIKDISDSSYYDEGEIAICNALKGNPQSITQLSEKVETSVYEIKIKRLEQHGVIMRSGLTPTDIMHINGNFTSWNKKGAFIGASIMSQRLRISLDKLVDIVNEEVKKKLYLNIVEMLIEKDHLYEGTSSEQTTSLILKGFNAKREGYSDNRCNFTVGFSSNLPLIGIGAPIHIYLPDVAKSLNTECIIPSNAGVANALGAITGNINVEEIVFIKPKHTVAGIIGYYCNSSEQNREFVKYEESLEWSKMEAERIATDKAIARGAGSVSTVINVNESNIDTFEVTSLEIDLDTSIDKSKQAGSKEIGKGVQILLETSITARAIGTLKWK